MSNDNLPVKPEEEHGTALEVAEPIPDPGLEPHEPRITDIDPKAADRVERQVSGMFGLATLLVLGACVAYFAIPRTRSSSSVRCPATATTWSWACASGSRCS